MADWYVWSGATGGGTGADWANAYVTLQAAAAAKAAGDTFYVAHDHYQTQASSALTITFPGTEVAPNRVYCVDRAGSVPPVAADLRTTAIIETTLVAAITINNSLAEAYGLNVRASSGGSAGTLTLNGTAGRTQRWVNCAFRCNGGNSGNRILPGTTGASMTIWENCSIYFTAAAQFLLASGKFFWRNSPNAFAAGASLSNLMSGSNAVTTVIEGVDLSAVATGTNLVANSGTLQTVTFLNCKLASGYKMYNPGTTAPGGPEIFILRCDSGGGAHMNERGNYMGAMYTETVIVRTGGASDGTTPVSWRVATNANTKWEIPFECLPITVWNETVGTPVTVTIEGVWGGGATPLNDEIWIDCEYRSVAGSPMVDRATSTKSSLAAGASLPAGSGTWGGSTTKFAMSATMTPQAKGPITDLRPCWESLFHLLHRSEAGADMSREFVIPGGMVSTVPDGRSLRCQRGSWLVSRFQHWPGSARST